MPEAPSQRTSRTDKGLRTRPQRPPLIKVILFSCCGFALDARAAAASDRMDLYVVRPLFELHLAPARSPVTFRRRLEAFSRTHGRPYSLQIR